MAHVFISHRHEDATLAGRAAQVMDAVGFAAWINPDPQVGEVWHPWTDPAIRASFALITLITPAAQSFRAAVSGVFTYEWAYALGANVPVIPVVHEAIEVPSRLVVLDPLRYSDDAPPWSLIVQRVQALVDARSWEAVPLPDDAPRPVRESVAALSSHDSGERIAALAVLAGLAELDDAAAQHALIGALGHPFFADVRLGAAELLGKVGGAMCVPRLVAALSDEDDAIRRAAVQSLVAIGPDAIPALAAAVTADDRMQRRGTVLALAQIESSDAVPGLIAALAVPDWFVPRTAAAALGRRGDAHAVPPLIDALSSDDPHLRELAAEALARIDTPAARAALARWRRVVDWG